MLDMDANKSICAEQICHRPEAVEFRMVKKERESVCARARVCVCVCVSVRVCVCVCFRVRAHTLGYTNGDGLTRMT